MITLAWYQAPQLAIMEMSGKPLQENVRQATETLYQWFDSSTAESVHLIVDQRRLEQLPSIATLTKVRVSPRRGWIILVSPPNKTLEFVSSVASQVLKMKVKFVETMPEAVDLLRKVVPELQDLEEKEVIEWGEVIGA